MRRLFLLAATLVLVASTVAVTGDPPADPKPDPAAKARATALSARYQEYARLLEAGVLIRCPTCNGKGYTNAEKFQGRRVVPIRLPCSYCKETGKKVSKEPFEKIFWKFRSPLWRARPDNRASVDAARDAIQDGTATPPAKVPPRVVRVDLVGDAHGVVTARDVDGPVLETRWLWAKDARTNETTWWLWSEETDGAWGASSKPAVAAEASRPLTEREAEEVAKIFASLSTAWKHQPSSAAVEGEVVVLSLALENEVREEEARTLLKRDAISVTRAALKPPCFWAGVRLVFLGPWRDEFGSVVTKPWMTTEASGDLVSKLVFANLTEDEVMGHFKAAVLQQPGFQAWWKK